MLISKKELSYLPVHLWGTEACQGGGTRVNPYQPTDPILVFLSRVALKICSLERLCIPGSLWGGLQFKGLSDEGVEGRANLSMDKFQ